MIGKSDLRQVTNEDFFIFCFYSHLKDADLFTHIDVLNMYFILRE